MEYYACNTTVYSLLVYVWYSQLKSEVSRASFDGIPPLAP